MFGGGITISGKLWTVAFHIMLFHILASAVGTLLMLLLIKKLLKTRIASSNRKPFKLKAPQVVIIE